MKTDKPTPRHYFKFLPWLVPKVRAGTKRCTIRKARKRLPKIGDTAVLECWTGKPYGSPVERLGEARLDDIQRVEMRRLSKSGGLAVILEGVQLTPGELEQLAHDDGFDSAGQFAQLFLPRCPFAGHLYRWGAITQPKPKEE